MPGEAQQTLRSHTLMWHSVPVPWTVSWTEEDTGFFIGPCGHSKRPAICQHVAPGSGKPLFGKPHSQRQREAVACELCDLCGKSLKVATKVSLSHARPQAHGVRVGDILQVEPLLHKACAAISVHHCPSLKRDLARGTAMVRQVMRHDVQFAIMDEIYCAKIAGEAVKAVGHAKVQLLKWIDRDPAWLGIAPLTGGDHER